MELLTLEQIELNIFRAPNTGGPFVFGGQVLGQALIAAANTVTEARLPHSLHGYFLRRGNGDLPIVYVVDRIRDGSSFTTRRVLAVQNGEAIFNMSISFQVREPGLEHQFPMPDVPRPAELADESDRFEEMMGDNPEFKEFHPGMRWPFSQRRVEQIDPFGDEESHPPYQNLWIKAEGDPGAAQVMHRALLAFASDMGFMSTATLPHGGAHMGMIQGASLDHSIWFHHDVAMDHWHLYQQESPAAAGARGFVRGSFYTEAGVLVASTTQECLIRVREQTGDEMDPRRRMYEEMMRRRAEANERKDRNPAG